MMNDRRLFRRYLAMVRRAEDVFESTLGDSLPPLPAEAVADLEDLLDTLAPAVRQMPDASPRPQEMAVTLAGWVH